MTLTLNKPEAGTQDWDIPVNENWDRIENEVNGKAATDLSNLTATGQAKFDAKANVDLSNLNNTGNAAASNLNSKGIRTVIETYRNGTSWYRVWSDGWIEQGGFIEHLAVSASVTVSFPKPFSETNYFCCPSWKSISYGGVGWTGRTTTGMTIQNAAGGATPIFWMACGY